MSRGRRGGGVPRSGHDLSPLVIGLLDPELRNSVLTELGVATQRERESWLSEIARAEEARRRGVWDEWMEVLVVADMIANDTLIATADAAEGERMFRFAAESNSN